MIYCAALISSNYQHHLVIHIIICASNISVKVFVFLTEQTPNMKPCSGPFIGPVRGKHGDQPEYSATLQHLFKY